MLCNAVKAGWQRAAQPVRSTPGAVHRLLGAVRGHHPLLDRVPDGLLASEELRSHQRRLTSQLDTRPLTDVGFERTPLVRQAGGAA